MNVPAQRRHVTKEEIQDSIVDGEDDLVTGFEALGSFGRASVNSQKRPKSSTATSMRFEQVPVIGLA